MNEEVHHIPCARITQGIYLESSSYWLTRHEDLPTGTLESPVGDHRFIDRNFTMCLEPTLASGQDFIPERLYGVAGMLHLISEDVLPLLTGGIRPVVGVFIPGAASDVSTEVDIASI